MAPDHVTRQCGPCGSWFTLKVQQMMMLKVQHGRILMLGFGPAGRPPRRPLASPWTGDTSRGPHDTATMRARFSQQSGP